MNRLLLVSLVTVVIIVLTLASLELFFPYVNSGTKGKQGVPSDFHVGVSFCGNTTAEARVLIDKVKAFTNLFVVQSGPVSNNETAMNEIVNYAVCSGLDVIVYFGFFNHSEPWQVPWLDYAKQTWKSHFLGVYLNDEPGGSTIDTSLNLLTQLKNFTQLNTRAALAYSSHEPAIDLALNGTLPIDNNTAASHFLTYLEQYFGLGQLETRSIHSFTSDYALYWFDYKGGYDTIFTEFGSNQSIVQAIDLTRGAARMQNKTWGAIITWTYDQSPYLENGTEMYDQLVAAYISGAKYEVIFDYPQISGDPYGVLTTDHFTNLEKFWNNIKTLKVNNLIENALVLPSNFGWGMRNQKDLIWGIWSPDNPSVGNVSAQIWNISQGPQGLLSKYGLNLDIVYEDQNFPVQGKYQQIYYYNQTL